MELTGIAQVATWFTIQKKGKSYAGILAHWWANTEVSVDLH